mgnify:CR=1 FL=1
MQNHIPFGYCVINGKCKIHNESGKIVHKIFEDYLSGVSTNQIAKNLMSKGVLNSEQKPFWYHGTVGRILENKKYLGDDFYPEIIDKDTFGRVQKLRICKAERLGRGKQPNSFVNKSIWNHILVCGQCGQQYRKYIRKNEEIWKCKHYIYKNKVCCKNLYLSEEQLEHAFITVINKVIQFPDELKESIENKTVKESVVEKNLTLKIQRMLKESYCDINNIKELAYQRAAERYKNTAFDERMFQTEKILNIINRMPIQSEFSPNLLENTIKMAVIQKEGRIEFYFKNGSVQIAKI